MGGILTNHYIKLVTKSCSFTSSVAFESIQKSPPPPPQLPAFSHLSPERWPEPPKFLPLESIVQTNTKVVVLKYKSNQSLPVSSDSLSWRRWILNFFGICNHQNPIPSYHSSFISATSHSLPTRLFPLAIIIIILIICD